MAEKKFAFELAAGLATQVLTQSKYVKGSYIIVKDIAERDALTICTGTGENDGVIIPGSLVYVTEDKTSYRYNGTNYEEVKTAAVSSFNYKGEVENYSDLPTKPEFGDIYKVNKRTVDGTEVTDGHTYFANKSETGIEWSLVSGTDDVVDLTEIEEAIGKDGDGNLVKVVDRIKSEAADADYSSDGSTTVSIKEKIESLETEVNTAITDSLEPIEEAIGTDDSGSLVKVTDRIKDEAVNATYDEVTQLTIKEKIESLETTIDGKQELYTNAAATTATIGGIAKGSTFNKKTMKEMWDMLLYPYVPFTLSSFVIRGTLADGTKATSGSYEWGTIINNIKEVSYSSIKLGSKTTGGTAELKHRVGSTGAYTTHWSSSTAMEDYQGFHDCSPYVTKWNGDTTLEYVFTISDGSTNISLTNKFTPVKYIYHLTSNQNSGLSPIFTTSQRGNESTITLSGSDKYIWFFCPDQNKTQIQQYALGQWNDMTTTYKGTCTVTLPTGAQVTYYAYIGPEMTAGSGKYRIN